MLSPFALMYCVSPQVLYPLSARAICSLSIASLTRDVRLNAPSISVTKLMQTAKEAISNHLMVPLFLLIVAKKIEIKIKLN